MCIRPGCPWIGDQFAPGLLDSVVALRNRLNLPQFYSLFTKATRFSIDDHLPEEQAAVTFCPCRIAIFRRINCNDRFI